MVQPTLRDRTRALDVLRGFAVLGILIANMPSFASRDLGGMTGDSIKLHGLDLWLDTLATVFVSGKMRSLLAIVFGVGVWMQFQKRSKVEGNWPGGYIKRSLWLGAIGLCHGFFIWFGDILFFYAGMAIVTALLAPVDARILKAIIGGGIAISLLCGVGLGVFIGMMATSSNGGGGGNPFGSFDPGAAFGSGNYLDQLKVRAILYGIMFVFCAGLGVAMLPLFLLGVLFGRSGVLAKPSLHPKIRNAALLVGFGVGVPMNLVGLLKLRGNEGVELFIEFTGGPFLAVGYLMLGAMLVEQGVLTRVSDALATVGRMALTSYLSQSVLATCIFYSWGLGLFGRLSIAGQFGVVAIIWTINIAFAYFWQRRFAIGPVEWLLRSLTEGKRLPIRRVADPELAPA